MSCVHCGRDGLAPRRRGLCYLCYNDLAIRYRYPPTAPCGRRNDDWMGEFRLPAEPTQTRVGTIERMRVYQERILRRESLFHPDDSIEIGHYGEFGRFGIHLRGDVVDLDCD